MSDAIRVLHVFGRLDRDGVEAMVMNIYRNIDRQKVQFDFVVHTNEKCHYHDEILSLGGRVFSVPRCAGKNHFDYNKVWKNSFTIILNIELYTDIFEVQRHMRLIR